jgi:hypothetical protein
MGAPPQAHVNFYEELKFGTWNARREMKGDSVRIKRFEEKCGYSVQ